jgi:hypothetical protein
VHKAKLENSFSKFPICNEERYNQNEMAKLYAERLDNPDRDAQLQARPSAPLEVSESSEPIEEQNLHAAMGQISLDH